MFGATIKGVLAAAFVMSAGAVLDTALNGGVVVPWAEARIGRPLTPLSYAGVARRTTRRAIYGVPVDREDAGGPSRPGPGGAPGALGAVAARGAR